MTASEWRRVRGPGAGGGRRTPREGFTLIEMVVAIFLATMVILSLASIYATVLKFQVEGYKKDVMHGGHVLAMKSLIRDVELATTILSPGPPCPSGDCTGSADTGANTLLGCVNFDADLGGVIDPSAKLSNDSSFADYPNLRVRWFRYCVAPCPPDRSSSGSDCLYRSWLEGNFSSCNPQPDPCNEAFPGGKLDVVAEWVSLDPTGFPFYFTRPAGLNNIVRVNFRIKATQGKAQTDISPYTVNTAILASKTFNSSSP